MPKKKKLKLGQLKIRSFVTEMDEKEAKKVKGGHTCDPHWSCASCIDSCVSCVTCTADSINVCVTEPL